MNFDPVDPDHPGRIDNLKSNQPPCFRSFSIHLHSHSVRNGGAVQRPDAVIECPADICPTTFLPSPSRCSTSTTAATRPATASPSWRAPTPRRACPPRSPCASSRWTTRRRGSSTTRASACTPARRSPSPAPTWVSQRLTGRPRGQAISPSSQNVMAVARRDFLASSFSRTSRESGQRARYNGFLPS